MTPVYLAYFDESGNTGMDLRNAQQPVFVLGCLLVPSDQWTSLENELEVAVQQFFGELDEEDREIHTHKLMSGSKPFRQFGLKHCLDFQKTWLEIAHSYQLKFFYRKIKKSQFEQWLNKQYGGAIRMNPHAMAFPLLSHVLNQHLQEMEPPGLGILISDEHKELSSDLEKSLRLLRANEGTLKHDRIIEKCFFIDSKKSLLLQLSDMCAYSARKIEEVKVDHPVRPHHQVGMRLIEPLITDGNEALSEIIDWMDQQIKKRPGT